MALRVTAVLLLANLLVGAMSESTEAKRDLGSENSNSGSSATAPKPETSNVNLPGVPNEQKSLYLELAKVSIATTTMQHDIRELKQQDTAFKQQLLTLQKENGLLREKIAKQNAAHQQTEAKLEGKASKGELQANSAMHTGKENELQNKINNLQQQDSTFTSQITILREQAEQASQISAFSAGIKNNLQSWHRGTIKFDKVLYMYGRGYSSDTGKFTAKISGLYFFDVTITNLRGDQECVAKLVVKSKAKEESLGEVYATKHEYAGQSSMAMVKYLNVGDVAKIDTVYGKCELRHYPMTKFSGFLIKAFKN